MTPKVEELQEQGGYEIVDHAPAGTDVEISIETHDYGSLRNLRIILQDTGEHADSVITQETFDRSSVDITLQPYPDAPGNIRGFKAKEYINRTLHIQDAWVNQIAWAFDAEGYASESYSLEASEATWYYDVSRDTLAVNCFAPTQDGNTGAGSCVVPLKAIKPTQKTFLKLYIDGLEVTGEVTITNLGASLPFDDGDEAAGLLEWTDTNFQTTGSRYRVLFSRNNPGIAIPLPSVVNRGALTRGQLNIYLTSGSGNLDDLTHTNFLRLQNANITADLSRNKIEEMCNYKPVELPIKRPVEVSISTSAYATDLEDIYKFTNDDFSTATAMELLSGFIGTGQVRVEMYDKNNTDITRSLQKKLTLSGLQLMSINKSVSVDGKLMVDMEMRGIDFELRGSGIIGTGDYFFPDFGWTGAGDGGGPPW